MSTQTFFWIFYVTHTNPSWFYRFSCKRPVRIVELWTASISQSLQHQNTTQQWLWQQNSSLYNPCFEPEASQLFVFVDLTLIVAVLQVDILQTFLEAQAETPTSQPNPQPDLWGWFAGNSPHWSNFIRCKHAATGAVEPTLSEPETHLEIHRT